MKRSLTHRVTHVFAIVMGIAALTLCGCAGTRDNEFNEMRSMMREQNRQVRAQLVAAGASRKQLQEFDQAEVSMMRQLRVLEKQMHAQGN